MFFSKKGAKVLAIASTFAFVLTGMSVAPGKAQAAADQAPTVKVLGATLRLDGDSGKQSLRFGIEVSNASNAEACGIDITCNGTTVTVGTDVENATLTKKNTTVYSKDMDNDKIVYSAVVTGITNGNYDKDFSVKGYVKEKVAESIKTETPVTGRNVREVVENLQKTNPAIELDEETGNLIKRVTNEETGKIEKVAVTKDDFTSDISIIPEPIRRTLYNMPLNTDTIKTDWGSNATFNEDGSVDVTITSQYGGFEFVIPESEEDFCTGYEIAYTGGNGNMASDFKYVGDTKGRDTVWSGLLKGTGTWSKACSTANKLKSVHIFSSKPAEEVSYPISIKINSFKCFRTGREPKEESYIMDLSKFVANGTASEPIVNEDGSLSIEYVSSYNGSAIELPVEYDFSNYRYVEISIASEKEGEDGNKIEAGNQINFYEAGVNAAMDTKYIGKGIVRYTVPKGKTLSKININPQNASSDNHEFTTINYIKFVKVNSIDLTSYIPGGSGFGEGESIVVNEDGTVTIKKTRNYDGSYYTIPAELQNCKTVSINLSTEGGLDNDGNSNGNSRVRFIDTEGKELKAEYIGGWNHTNANITYTAADDKKIGMIIFETQAASAENPILMNINYIELMK